MNAEDNVKTYYQLLNEKLDKQVDEFYQINQAFLLIQTLGIFGVMSSLSSMLSIIPIVVLLVTAVIWQKILYKAHLWRNHYVDSAKKIEDAGLLGQYKLWRETENIRLKPAWGVWATLNRLPIIFYVTWGSFLLVYVIKFSEKISLLNCFD